MMTRCSWCGDDELYVKYHDTEWGVPQYDDTMLFEMLLLEGAQAGLSWITVLRKRENYRLAYEGFNPETVARFDEDKIAELLDNPGIVRNKRKVHASIKNAKAFLEIQKEFGSFSEYIWRFVDHKQIKNSFNSLEELPAQTPLSQRISKDLKKRGMSFVGPTIIYSFMQAVGMVNDHIKECYRYNEIK